MKPKVGDLVYIAHGNDIGYVTRVEYDNEEWFAPIVAVPIHYGDDFFYTSYDEKRFYPKDLKKPTDAHIEAYIAKHLKEALVEEYRKVI